MQDGEALEALNTIKETSPGSWHVKLVEVRIGGERKKEDDKCGHYNNLW